MNGDRTRNRRQRVAQIMRAVTQHGPLPYAVLAQMLPGVKSAEWVSRVAMSGEDDGLLQGLTSTSDLAPGLTKQRPSATRYAGIRRAAGGCVIGVNVGRTYFAIGVADPNGQLLSVTGKRPPKELTGKRKHTARARYRKGQIIMHRREPGLSGLPMLRHIAQEMVNWATRLSVDNDEIRGITLSLPVPVSTTHSRTLSSSIEPTLHGVNDIERVFRSILDNRYPNLQKVVVANDADIAARGEVRYGNAYGLGDIVAIHAAFGIGAGVITDGSILHTAAGGGAGEIGHCVATVRRDSGKDHKLIPLDPDHPTFTCACGNSSHLEAMAGGEAVVRRIEHSLGALDPPTRVASVLRDPRKDIAAKLSALLTVSSAEDGWAPGHAALLDAAHAIGGGAHTLAHMFNPAKIFVTGKLSEAGEPFRKAVEEGFEASQPLENYSPPISLGHATDSHTRRRIMVNGAAMTAVRSTEPLFFVRNPDFEQTGEFEPRRNAELESTRTLVD